MSNDSTWASTCIAVAACSCAWPPTARCSARLASTTDALSLAAALADAGPEPEVVMEATLGWYWAADVVEECGARLHLAHPLAIKAFAYQRVKKDESDARLLADLLRMGRLPESWIAPREIRELRELVRYRHKVVETRANAKAQVHAVLAKQGVRLPMSDLFGRGGTKLVNELALDDSYLIRVESLRDLIACHGREIAMLDRAIATRLQGHRGYEAIQAIPGWARCWLPSSSPRSATSVASPGLNSWPPGRE